MRLNRKLADAIQDLTATAETQIEYKLKRPSPVSDGEQQALSDTLKQVDGHLRSLREKAREAGYLV